jgi:hypothetical protein
MATIIQHSIAPPFDPETILTVRNSLNYYVVLPQGYKETEPCGFVFTITGYGSTADDEYYKNKLNTYIADKYGFIVAGVRYHNDARITSERKVDIGKLTAYYRLPQNYFASNTNIIDKLHDLLISRKLFRIDPQCAMQADAFHKYSSFGFMPAIDHLCVLHDILGKYAIDKRFISVLGTSYGGYIASVMGKYAPYTFSLIINNSGFSVAQLSEILGSKMGDEKDIDGELFKDMNHGMNASLRNLFDYSYSRYLETWIPGKFNDVKVQS